MFEDEKIRLIDAMTNGVMVIYVWLRLLVQAGKINANGYIYLTENIPYTEEMLSTLFCKSLESIKFALKILCDFQMIEVDSKNIIKILNWDKHQNIEGMERVRAQNKKRAEAYREKKKQIEKTAEENNDNEKIIPLTNVTDLMDDSQVSLKDNSEGNLKENYLVKSKTNSDDEGNSSEDTSNVIVTEQKERESKKEIENKNENKKEIESESKKEIKRESNNIAGDANNKVLAYEQEVKQSSLSQGSALKENPKAIAENDINANAMELLTHYEKITGIVGGLNFGSLKLAIEMHGEKPVKMAINRALEVNKHDMAYINGILKNWRREGYPKEGEEIINGNRSNGKNNSENKNEFVGFKAKRPRNLTAGERKRAEENLI